MGVINNAVTEYIRVKFWSFLERQNFTFWVFSMLCLEITVRNCEQHSVY